MLNETISNHIHEVVWICIVIERIIVHYTKAYRMVGFYYRFVNNIVNFLGKQDTKTTVIDVKGYSIFLLVAFSENLWPNYGKFINHVPDRVHFLIAKQTKLNSPNPNWLAIRPYPKIETHSY